MTTARREDRGQATVEFALVLPLVALLVLLLAQAGMVVRDQVLLTHAAREAARAAAVAEGDRSAAARRSAEQAGPLSSDRLAEEVDLVDGGASVRVVVHYRSVTDLPLVGLLLPDVDLDARAVMRAESLGQHGP